MAHHKDAEKRARQNENRRVHNRHYRSMMRSAIKKLRLAVEDGDGAAAAEQLPEAVGIIQRLAQKGLIHKKQAARRVSRLANAVNGLRSN